MDENIDPNRANLHATIHGDMANVRSERFLRKGSITDINLDLINALSDLEDGEVAVVDDLVAIRAGPETYHPIKALKVWSGSPIQTLQE